MALQASTTIEPESLSLSEESENMSEWPALLPPAPTAEASPKKRSAPSLLMACQLCKKAFYQADELAKHLKHCTKVHAFRFVTKNHLGYKADQLTDCIVEKCGTSIPLGLVHTYALCHRINLASSMHYFVCTFCLSAPKENYFEESKSNHTLSDAEFARICEALRFDLWPDCFNHIMKEHIGPFSMFDKQKTSNASLMAVTETLYECPFCSAKLRKKQLLLHHVRTKHQDVKGLPLSVPQARPNSGTENMETSRSPLSCPHCSESFNSKSVLEKHKFFCSFVQKGLIKLPAEIDWSARVERKPSQAAGASGDSGIGMKVTGHGKRLCPVKGCRTKSIPVEELELHKQCHVDNSGCLRCFKCAFTPGVNTWHALKCHFIAVHPTFLPPPHQCTICGKGFMKLASCRAHSLRHDVMLHFHCLQCKVSFTSRVGLKNHLLNKHTEKGSFMGDRRLLCHVCGFQTTDAKYLKEHLEIHKGTKRFKCSVCAYATADRTVFKRHLWTHKISKRFSCSHCDYTCTQHAQLQGHIRSKHALSRDVPSAEQLVSSNVSSAKLMLSSLVPSANSKEILPAGGNLHDNSVASCPVGVYEQIVSAGGSLQGNVIVSGPSDGYGTPCILSVADATDRGTVSLDIESHANVVAVTDTGSECQLPVPVVNAFPENRVVTTDCGTVFTLGQHSELAVPVSDHPENMVVSRDGGTELNLGQYAGLSVPVVSEPPVPVMVVSEPPVPVMVVMTDGGTEWTQGQHAEAYMPMDDNENVVVDGVFDNTEYSVLGTSEDWVVEGSVDPSSSCVSGSASSGHFIDANMTYKSCFGLPDGYVSESSKHRMELLTLSSMMTTTVSPMLSDPVSANTPTQRLFPFSTVPSAMASNSSSNTAAVDTVALSDNAVAHCEGPSSPGAYLNIIPRVDVDQPDSFIPRVDVDQPHSFEAEISESQNNFVSHPVDDLIPLEECLELLIPTAPSFG